MDEEFLQAHDRRAHRRVMAGWASLALLLALLVVGLGAWTRLSDAGLGCPDWPGCYGFLHVPHTPEQIALAGVRFPDAPVEAVKGWPEMVHRYAAGTLGLVVLGIALFAVAHRRDVPVWHSLGLLGLVLLQGAFGMWTVTLKLWPQVVSAHLLGGFATVSLLFLLCLRLMAHHPPLPRSTENRLVRLRPWLWLAVLLVVLQIGLGAWTAANYAAMACTSFPTCQGVWWPAMDFRHGFDLWQQQGPNYLGGQLENSGRVAIHMTHRIGAGAVLLVVGSLLIACLRATHHTPLAGWVLLAVLCLLGQIALGLANVWLHLPLAVAVAHNIGGVLLLLSLLNLGYRMHRLRAAAGEPHSLSALSLEARA